MTQSHFISLPRVVAIIAEALAVEVLPPRPPCQGQAHRHCQASPGEDKNSFLPVSDQNSIYMLQGNAGVFEACVNALSEPQKLAIRTVLA